MNCSASCPTICRRTKSPWATVPICSGGAGGVPPHFGPEALLASVESGAIAALRGSEVVALHKRGGRLRRRQDLPPEAFFPAAELRRLVEALGEDWFGRLFVALSYRWLAAAQPDAEGFHLGIVAAVAQLQLEELNSFIAEHVDPDEPLLVQGDFNLVPSQLEGRLDGLQLATADRGEQMCTWRKHNLEKCRHYDHFFYRGGHVLSYRMLVEDEYLSDHVPIELELELDKLPPS